MIRYNLSFAGAGRVAGSLCHEMYQRGHTIVRIVSETEEYGQSLAKSCNALWSSELVYPESTDILIVAVPDHKLKEVLHEINCNENTVVAHTAGSLGLDVFPSSIKRNGIFYPLQTFTPERQINFHDLPFMIEANNSDSEDKLNKLAHSLEGEIYNVDTKSRIKIHLAAVFVCNFTNHLLTVGKEIATKSGLPFSVLEPLIRETISKALENGPEKSQTGPAVRNDKNTIEKQMDLLSFSPELQDIYKYMTDSIMEYYKRQLDD